MTLHPPEVGAIADAAGQAEDRQDEIGNPVGHDEREDDRYDNRNKNHQKRTSLEGAGGALIVKKGLTKQVERHAFVGVHQDEQDAYARVEQGIRQRCIEGNLEPEAERKGDEGHHPAEKRRKQEFILQQPMDGERFGPDAAEEIGLNAQPPLGKTDSRIENQEGKEDGIEPTGVGGALRKELEKEDTYQDEHAGLQPFGPHKTPGLDPEYVMSASLPEGAAGLRGHSFLQRIIPPVLQQHHDETTEDREKIDDEQHADSPGERQEQEAGRDHHNRQR